MNTRIARPPVGQAELEPPTLGQARRVFAPIGQIGTGLLARPTVQDALVAAVLTATSLVGVAARWHVDIPEGGGEITARGLDALGICLALLQTVPLAWRRRAPLVVLSVTTAACYLFSVLGYFPSFAALGFLVALYTVSAYRDRRASIPAALASVMAILLILVVGREPVEPDTIIAECLIIGAVWCLGDGFRIRRGQVVHLEDRAKQLEWEREERAHHAVAEERRVIARELHDVVAHNVSVIVAQAGAAQRIFGAHPEQALGALGAIEDTGREALVEMRRLTGFLRTETDPAVTRSPQPGLKNLDVLVAQVREAGIPVTLRIEGTPRPLPAGLDLSAFRIIQEALTNILKHAGPAQADLVVRYTESRLEVAINDNGFGPGGSSTDTLRPRYGHLGMSERIALFGGDLRMGARRGGGYHVTASLPLDGKPS
jgi:signal transduction histidine kinase